ncbi:hypothetical protein Tco_0954672 [Tanacetum coccineum]|uniref:Retrovirus-related Pol polyprotein from transposon TNT 1-94-like beta-barrel domain-containing protein n=1 Tax=Tanacetum coccineum TaxID=301880 RepID=A0ABQ5E513_9ASTR
MLILVVKHRIDVEHVTYVDGSVVLDWCKILDLLDNGDISLLFMLMVVEKLGVNLNRKRISDKRKKNEAKNDKTEHGMEEREKDKVVQIILWYLDSGCSKHMTGDRSQLTNFVNKFLGTIKFGNDHVAKILGYGDYQIGNVTISRVYFVEGLGHNLFSVRQFCDSNLEVAFRQHTCFIRNLEGVDLLTGS